MQRSVGWCNTATARCIIFSIYDSQIQAVIKVTCFDRSKQLYADQDAAPAKATPAVRMGRIALHLGAQLLLFC